MPDLVGYAAKKLFSEAVTESLKADDPYYEYVEGKSFWGKNVKKRVKRQPPQGISKHDEKILKQISRRAYHLDLAFSLCGFRAGWTLIIGLIPVIGDILNMYLGLAILRRAEQVEGGIPMTLRSKMMANITIDFLLQLTPVLGDIAGAVYKSNSRNALLLEHYLRSKTKPINISVSTTSSTARADINQPKETTVELQDDPKKKNIYKEGPPQISGHY